MTPDQLSEIFPMIRTNPETKNGGNLNNDNNDCFITRSF